MAASSDDNNTGCFVVCLIIAILFAGRFCNEKRDTPPDYNTPGYNNNYSDTAYINENKATKPSASASETYGSSLKKRRGDTYRRRIPRSSHNYIRGPRGGCYYINSNGNKVYVDRSLCD